MSAEYFFSRVWVVVSVVVVLIAIFLSYFNFPDVVAVHHEQNKPAGFLGKESVFYLTVGIVIATNVLLMFMGRTFAALPDAAIRLPNNATWLTNRKALNMRFANWTRLLQGILNFVVCMALYALAMVNLQETKKTIADYQWMIWVAAFGLILWLFWFPVRVLFFSPTKNDEADLL